MKKLIRPMAPVALLLLATSALRADGPYSVDSIRAGLKAELARLTQVYSQRIPDTAYTYRTVNGQRVRVELNTQHPGYRRVLSEWHQACLDAQRHFNGRDAGRWDYFQKVLKENGLQGKIHNTGSVPKRCGSDIDLIAESPQAARDLARGLRSHGHEVIELGDRFIDKNLDLTLWKDPPAVEVSSQEYITAVEEGALLHSDKFSTAGGKYFTSQGKVGVRDPAGAVIDNMHKLSDSGATSLGRRFRPAEVDWHTAGKSVSKAAEIGGLELDPKFQRQIQNLRNHQNIDQALDLLGKTPQQRAAEIEAFRKKLVETSTRALENATVRSQKIDQLRMSEIRKLETAGRHAEARAARESLADARMSRQVSKDVVAMRDPMLTEQFYGASQNTRARFEARRARLMKIARRMVFKARVKAAAKKWGSRALTGLWIAHAALSAADEEAEAALREGRDPSRLMAFGRGILEGLFITPTIHSWNQGTSLRDKRLAEYDAKYGDNHWGIEARAMAMWDAVKIISCYNLGARLGDEALEREMERALAAGEEPSRIRFMADGAVSVLGEILMISSICRSLTRDWDAEARMMDMDRTMRKYVSARVNGHLEELHAIDTEIAWLRANTNPYSEYVKKRIAELRAKKQKQMERIHELAVRMRRHFGAQDPLIQGLYDLLKRIGYKGGYVAMQQRQRSWYCTNRPEIGVDMPIPDLLERKNLTRASPRAYAKAVQSMEALARQRGLDLGRLPQLHGAAIGRLGAAGQPNTLLRPLQARYLRALSAEKPEQVAENLRGYARMVEGLSPEAAAEARRFAEGLR